MEEFIEEAYSTLCGWGGCKDCVHLRKALEIINDLRLENLRLRKEYVDTFLKNLEGNEKVINILLPIETVMDAANWGAIMTYDDVHMNNIHISCINALENNEYSG
jgi:hypothetical protein